MPVIAALTELNSVIAISFFAKKEAPSTAMSLS
jgi:hypothetical protein